LRRVQIKMKSARDPRHQRRRKAVQELFASSFVKSEKPTGPISELSQKVLKSKKILDQKISKAAPTWPIDKLNKIDLAILRLAIYEIKNETAPPKVVIDEAVELAKEFGGEASPSFVNGVLGTILKSLKK